MRTIPSADSALAVGTYSTRGRGRRASEQNVDVSARVCSSVSPPPPIAKIVGTVTGASLRALGRRYGSDMEIGYAFSSEEHTPAARVEHAVAAEEAGFTWGLISDHIHPWGRRAGAQPVRLDDDRREPDRDRAVPHRHGRHVPADLLPPGDRGPRRRDLRGARAGAALPRRRHRREPERARDRLAPARTRRARRHA